MPRKYIGTSGWAYKEWSEKFFPKDVAQREHLKYLSSKFNTVEVNSTFYRLQPEHNYRKWNSETPKDFRFAIKVSRFITHRKQPIDIDEPWRRLAQPAKLLGAKLGPFLFQFPPSFRLNDEWLDWLDVTIPKLRREYAGLRLAMELRHKEAMRTEALERLKRHDFAIVIANSSRFPTAPHAGWADFAYFRFHGPRELFSSDYSPEDLRPWADRVQAELAKGKDIYAYFNNDYHAYAPGNAELLVKLLS